MKIINIFKRLYFKMIKKRKLKYTTTSKEFKKLKTLSTKDLIENIILTTSMISGHEAYLDSFVKGLYRLPKRILIRTLINLKIMYTNKVEGV